MKYKRCVKKFIRSASRYISHKIYRNLNKTIDKCRRETYYAMEQSPTSLIGIKKGAMTMKTMTVMNLCCSICTCRCCCRRML